jgi:hypothetical protein
MKAAGKQKDEAVANHVYRALGRCGAGDSRVRALLLKKAAGGKSEFATFGPAIGLAYFQGDAKAARGVEEILKQLGIPGGRRGGGQNSIKRGVLSWTLAAIGDRKSGRFVREELIGGLENVKAFWVEGMKRFWTGVAEACESGGEDLSGVEEGVRVIAGFARRWTSGSTDLMDEARQDRDNTDFTPKGDNILGGGGAGGRGDRGEGGGREGRGGERRGD